MLPASVRRVIRTVSLRPYTCATVVLLVALAWPFMKKTISQWDSVYVAAAERLVQGGDLFTEGYFYPPFMALASVPFTWVSQPVSRFAWYVVSAVCLVLLWRWAWRLAGGGRLEGNGIAWPEHVVCLVGVACAVRYGFDGLQNQQTDLVIAGLLLGGCLLIREGRWLLAATCLGLAAGMKCTALLWCPFLLHRRQWLAAFWLPVCAVGVNLLPDVVRGPEGGGLWVVEWANRHLTPIGQDGSSPGRWPSSIVYNQSLAGAANRAFLSERYWAGHMFRERPRDEPMDPVLAKRLLYGGELALLSVCVIVLWSRRRQPGAPPVDSSVQDGLEFSLVLLLMPLLSPMSSKPHFCTLLLPAFLLARLAVSRRSPVLAGLLAGAILAGVLTTKDLVGNYLASWMMWHGGVTISTCLLLAGCLFALTRGLGQRSQAIGGSPHQTPFFRAAA